MRHWTWREIAGVLVIAAVVLGFLVFLWIAQPGYMAPMLPTQ
jgi:hypothetical protein